ncbi:related to 35 kDa ribonuclease H [Sporisorium reilianum SRZ2]|uniref:Ribonuclease n=1 Tax=Sporisorium reilianum (strain SRZ2) TaxID=999809 RepID=E6ZVT5_SPORE|nr:related to 35 kDa ribonuclease H [Sporisorium reilianum SRZ2]
MPPKKTKKPSKAAAAPQGDDGIDTQQDDLTATPPPPIPSEPSAAITQSYTYASPVPAECSRVDATNPAIRVPCVLGVDEAGRGPVLGPLVYGIAYCPVSYQDSLAQIGFADSKALTPERRSTLLTALIEDETLGWAVRVMAPQDISAGMLRRRPVNLNAQSSSATVSLIQGVLDSGVDVTEIYVDTVGDAKSYARLLASHFPRHPHVKWTVTSKADAIYPIVGAASIAAKVTRDRCVEGWRYAEQPVRTECVLGDATNVLHGEAMERKRKECDDDVDVWTSMGALGSGYPGDPNTVAYLKRTLDPVFGWPGIVRFSWATAKTMLDEKVAPTLGGKRLTRTSSFASDPTSAPTPASLYGTRLPQPSVVGGTAPRGYKVKWIDEPVSISKFFGAKKPAVNGVKGSLPQTGTDSGEVQPSALQLAINGWLKQETQPKPAAAPDAIQVSVAKLTKDLGLTCANAAFTL